MRSDYLMRFFVPAVVASQLVGAVAVAASAEGDAANSGQLDEVVVTATRREERLQDVPITVTAFIGLGGLGQLIIQGFSENGFHTPIVVGLVLSIVLAGVADALIVASERLAVPWIRRRAV